MDAKTLGSILRRFPGWSVRIGREIKTSSSTKSKKNPGPDALVGPEIANISWKKDKKTIVLILALPPLEQPSTGLIASPERKLWLPGDPQPKKYTPALEG